MIILYSALFFLLGSILASFTALVGQRIPKKQKITGRSLCDNCNHNLRLIDVIPIFGYIINLGKCHYCKKPINPSYFIGELLVGILFSFSYLIIGLDIELIIAFIFITVLFTEVISDLLYQTVIDSVWLIGLIPIIIIRLVQGIIIEHLISASILFVVLFLISYLGKKTFKKEALGGGDIKLYILIGFILNVWLGLLSLFFASILALIYALIRKKAFNNYLPLVPFISISVIILYFYGENIINWYLSLFGM